MSLLAVSNLEVSFASRDGVVHAVNDLSFELAPNQTLGIVGESGSGKSQTALAIMGLLAPNATVQGAIRFEGRELLGMPSSELNRVRGSQIGMIFQDPMTSLNPYLTIGAQMTEALRQHRGMTQAEALRECLQMLDAVRISDASRRLSQYPHEISGGQRQRVMIAMTLLCRPQLLIADEPTTALDVTVQAQILKLLNELRHNFKLAVILITHDFGVVAEFCDQTLVMYAGQMMESGPTQQLLTLPTHPYTRGLLDSRPGLDMPVQESLGGIPGQPPDPIHLGPGCPFEPRCGQRLPECSGSRPLVETYGAVRRSCFGRV